MKRSPRYPVVAVCAAVGFVAAIIAANWLTNRYGFVPVGFGLTATAGTYAAGSTFTLRDGIQDTLGRDAVLIAITVGVVISVFVASPGLAVASGVAFAVSELADFAVFTPLRPRSWTVAVVISGLVGAAIDTLIFIPLAFGRDALTLEVFAGQLVGKAWMVVAVMALLGFASGHRRITA